MKNEMKRSMIKIFYRIIFSTLILLLNFPPFCFAQNQNIRFKHLTTDEGLSHSYIRCIFQDNQGFMWFGTFDGLNKYDGYDFIIYRHKIHDPKSITANVIRSICEDSQGNLWIATMQGLCLYDRKRDTFVNYNQQNGYNLENVDIWNIFQDSQGNLWIGTNNRGLYLFNPEINQTIYYTHNENDPNSISSNNVRQIFEDSKGNIWIATDGGGLNIFNRDKKTFTHYKHNRKKPRSIIGNTIYSIVEDARGYLWFACYGDGLSSIHIDKIAKQSFTNYTHNPKNNKSLSSNLILSLCVDKNGGIWIGTENGGLDFFKKNRRTFIHFQNDQNDPNSLNNNSIYSVYQDKIGDLWIGTYAGGVNIINQEKQAFKHFKNLPGNPNSLSSNSVWEFHEDRQGKIWIATDGGGLNKFDPKTGNFEYYNSKNSNLKSDAVLTVFVDSQNDVWIGTWAGGISLFNRKKKSFHTFTSENSDLSNNNIFDIVEDRNGNLWIATQEGLNKFNKKDKSFVTYTVGNSDLISKFVEILKVDRYNNILIGTVDGFIVFNPEEETFINYTYDPENLNSISNNFITSIFEENDSSLWISTSNGLNKLNRKTNKITHYFQADGLLNDLIFGIEKDNQGYLWISTNEGISRFNPKTETFKNFTKEDGLQGKTFIKKSHYKSRNRKIYFGGVNGFNVFDPRDVVDNKVIPPIVIIDFQIFNKPVQVGAKNSPLNEHISFNKKLTLSYKQSVFSFKFTALNYISSSKNQYAYFLEGFEHEWNYVGNKREATYTNLNPGKYTFRIKGSNNDGVWNEEGTSLEIIITPPFWQTWWFRIIMLILIITVIFAVHKIRVRNIEAHRRELEIKVKERTQQLNEKAKELENSYKDLAVAKNETDNILHNVEEGFFLLDKEYIISSQYSSALESIFSTKKLAHLNLIDFIRDKIPASEIENTMMYFSLLFDESVDENSIVTLNPLVDLEFIFSGGKRSGNENGPKISKYLNFSFKRIRSDENKIIELIVTVRDVTSSILLAKQLKEEEARRERLLQLMLGILDVDPEMLNEFSESAQRELAFIDQIMNHEKIKDYQALLVKVHRAMHLIKGNAKLLNIDYFAQAAHQFEDLISEVQKKRKITPKDIEPLRVKLRELETGIEEMEKIIEKMGQVLTHKGGKKKTDARSLLLSLENLIKSFSSDLGKKIKFNYKKFKSQIIPSRYHLLVKEVLIQLIRNSISHGIEFPEERKRLKKPQYGKIEISTFKKNGSIGFRLRDDGRGIQIEKLRETALKTGKWKAEDINSWTNQQIAELIFKSGITTAKNVNMLAGRGVGMDGVVHRLQEYQGKINVHFAEGKYCEFEILLPAVS
jgi:ligand-binding sensor domain-containing protein/HPt (histidine-containing phosphotransfer) domain-containing protein